MRAHYTLIALIAVMASLFGGTVAHAQAQATPAKAAPSAEQRIAAIKQNLARSQKNIKQYQWTETTVVSYKGEEKSSTTYSCAYGADGKVAKTETSAPEEHKRRRGVRGRVAEHEIGELKSYMESAVALIKTYVPPDPAKIQACKEAGKVSVTMTDPGKRVKLDFKDYEKPGDDLGVEIDMATNQILGLSVASYLADEEDAVTLNVTMASLPDTTEYPATIQLDAPAKKISVAIKNSGYEKREN